jgi:hypothetical protein
MDPAMIFQAMMDALPLLVLRVLCLVLSVLALVLAVCAIGALGCQRTQQGRS